MHEIRRLARETASRGPQVSPALTSRTRENRMVTDTVTIDQFIDNNGITIKAKSVDRNPHMSDTDMDHWKCVLARPGKRMTVTFSKGYGHNGAEPTAAEVLDCLASDAAGLDNSRNFEDWCSEYGYNEDSRTAWRTYKTVVHEAVRLRHFLLDGLYDQLLYQVERQ